MRPTNNNNNTRRPSTPNNGNRPSNPSVAGRRYNNNNARPNPSTGGNAQSRTNAIYDRDEMSDIVNPAQRRHASNQQTKFLDLAKNAKQQGDRVEVEYYMQHVEHYTRILNMAEVQDEARHKERNVRHSPQQHSQSDDYDEDGQDAAQNESGQDEAAPHSEETEEQRLARVERNRAKRRNRKLKRNSYASQTQAEPPSEQQSDQQSEKLGEDSQTEASPDAAPSAPKIRRVPIRAKRAPTIQADLLDNTPQNTAENTLDNIQENNGESLRDVLPSSQTLPTSQTPNIIAENE